MLATDGTAAPSTAPAAGLGGLAQRQIPVAAGPGRRRPGGRRGRQPAPGAPAGADGMAAPERPASGRGRRGPHRLLSRGRLLAMLVPALMAGTLVAAFAGERAAPDVTPDGPPGALSRLADVPPPVEPARYLDRPRPTELRHRHGAGSPPDPATRSARANLDPRRRGARPHRAGLGTRPQPGDPARHARRVVSGRAPAGGAGAHRDRGPHRLIPGPGRVRPPGPGPPRDPHLDHRPARLRAALQRGGQGRRAQVPVPRRRGVRRLPPPGPGARHLRRSLQRSAQGLPRQRDRRSPARRRQTTDD